ncbi:MAG: hypothetical protein J1E05_04435 [Eubacterium sp.]|nr:hypothetical protein [Eubacterium sp.]
MKKKALIIIPVLLVLVIAGVVIGIATSNNSGKKTEPQEVRVDTFGEFQPFECKGDYVSFRYIDVITNRDGTLFYSKSLSDNSDHKNSLSYALVNGEQGNMFTISDPNVDIDVVAYIDDALYYNISNAQETSMNGLYRAVLTYDESGFVSESKVSLRFSLNLEPVRAEDNTILLRSGEQYYTFDTQTGKCTPYN